MALPIKNKTRFIIEHINLSNSPSLKILYIFLLFNTIFFIKTEAQNIIIEGKVVNQDNSAIVSANISLKNINHQNLIVNTTVTSTGEFKIDLKPGKYTMLISEDSYLPWQSTFEITTSIDLKVVKLYKKVNELKEVEIKNIQNAITHQSDRLILNVENNGLTSGKSALQLFSLIPSVWVEQSGDISINGNGGSHVMIDGKLLRFSREQLKSYLSSLKAEEVSKIEVMAHPPAEYDAEGSSGLINIILKKKTKAGLSGSLITGIIRGKYTSFTNSALLNYNVSSWFFYGSYNVNNSKDYTIIQDERAQNMNTYSAQSIVKPTNDNNRFNLGMGYDLTKLQSFDFDFSGSFNKQNSTTTSQSIIDQQLASEQIISGNFNSLSKNEFYNLTLNYKLKTDSNGSNFKVQANYVDSQNNGYGNFQSNYLNNDLFSIKDSIYRNQLPNNTKNASLAVDFAQVLSKKTSLAFGGKFSSTDTHNAISYQSFENQQYVAEPAQSNEFKYLEKIGAGYIKLNSDISNFQFTVGLRGEYTSSEGKSITLGTAKNDSYFNLFPSIFIKKDLDSKIDNSLSFYAGRRLTRPSFADLNPFVLKIDDYTSVVGNSNLQPQFTNAFELSYTLYQKYYVSAFYNRTNNVFAQILISSPNNGISAIYQRQNIDVLNNYGINLYAPTRILKWWSMSNSAIFYQNDYKFQQNNNNQATYLLKSYHDFDISHGFRFQALASYKSKSSQGDLTFKPNYQVDFAIQKSILKNKIKLDFTVNDAFNTSRSDYFSDYDGFYLNEKQKYQTRIYTLTMSYNFLKGEKFNPKKMDHGNDEETSRIRH